MLRYIVITLFLLLSVSSRILAQHVPLAEKAESKPLKLEHAEPLFIDLIRDLGAHKGEREWNIGAGLTDNLAYDHFGFLVEYEWAPIDRLGLEVEVPVSMYSRNSRDFKPELNRPSNKVESLKLAGQYTFLVSAKYQTSMALGTIGEFELKEPGSNGSLLEGFLYNPFLVIAKRWGKSFHSLVYTGPRVHFPFHHSGSHVGYELHTSIHYMIPSTQNFIGLEMNKEVSEGKFTMVARPQMRVTINDGFKIGIVPGIPITRREERLSSFVRLIYEPKHHK